jgi:tetratricopeptide (TPR) repeat protein/tRNA A-37 threonylcarbamoyl transferase component Bud32
VSPSPGDRFRRCEELFHAAIALGEGEREPFLESACEGDRSLRVEVERLLAAHARADALIDTPAAAHWPAEAVSWEGHRIGPYRVVRELGRGGMGAVYLAERADGQYEQRVALKLIKRGMDTEQVLDRFRAERQILASLDHPNIARLLDGGSTEQGTPFFAMEYIEGDPIDAYADRKQLSVEERVQLFLQVCGAVAYAHQHLVIHRDIKPLNVLVTADGTPKLLDFGIAKVLHPDADEATSTVTGMRLLTPEYASPEQVDGRHATTVSDVYSLGVVLYELLTGRSPYRPKSRTPIDVVEAVRTTDPERPSAASSTGKLRKRLRGDLDTILLTALRKEPDRRYQSVDQLATDLRRHLDGRPVRARPDTFGYRAGKFVRRNRVAVAAGTLVALAMVAGTVATAYQARQARAAQARAERRFADVRKLANALLFDYHDAIRDLKGARPVRERLVHDALGYFDGLAQEAHDDSSLQRELAAVYLRVGDLQKSDPSPGADLEGAAQSYAKALSMLDRLLLADSGDARVRRDAAKVSLALGGIVWERGDLQGGLEHARRARAFLEPLLSGSPESRELRLQLATAIDRQGQIALEAGDIAGALDYHRAELRLLEAGPDSQRSHHLVRHALSVAYGHLADAQVEAADLKGALASHRRSLAIRLELAREHPENQVYADNVSHARYYLASVLGRLGQWEEALALHRQNFAADSTGGFICRLGEALVGLGRYEEGLRYFRRALTVHVKELRADTVNLFRKLAVVEDEARICKTLARLGQPDASDNCRRATRFMDAIEVAPDHAFPRAFMAAAWTNIGDAYEIIGTRSATSAADRRSYRSAAVDMYERSLTIWSDLEARKLVSPVDTGLITAARRAVVSAKALARPP